MGNNVQDLSTIRLAFMAQSDLDELASGSGAVSLDVLASQGIQSQVATIESAMIKRNRMRARPRHGLTTATASYETEHLFGLGPNVFYEGVLGGTWAVPLDQDQTDFTSLTIVAGDTSATQKVRRAAGSWLTDEFTRGMVFRLSGMSTAGNNGKWTPIVDISANGLDLIVPAGILTNQGADAVCGLTRAAYIVTSTPYVDRYFTVEEYLAELNAAKRGNDMRPNALNFAGSADANCKIGFGFGGRKLDSVSGPVFDDPDSTVDANSFLLDDGMVLFEGVPRADLREITFGLSAPVSGIKLIGSADSPDVFLGQFGFTAQITAALMDDSLLTASADETVLDILAFAKHQTRERFVSFYMGEATFAGFGSPMGGEGATIQTIGVYGGDCTRGTGFPAGTLLISTGDDS